jgi:hypothetical protein
MTAEQKANRDTTHGMIALTILSVVGYAAFVYACRCVTGIW